MADVKICDRCRAITTNHAAKLSGDPNTVAQLTLSNRADGEFELCADCVESFRRWFGSGAPKSREVRSSHVSK